MSTFQPVFMTVLAYDAEDDKHSLLLGYFNKNDVPEDRMEDFYLTEAERILKESFAKQKDETLSYTDFKLAQGTYQVKEYQVHETPAGLAVVPEQNTMSVLRTQMERLLETELTEDLKALLQPFAAVIKAQTGTLPEGVWLEFGSEYDDNNYYTDLTEVHIVMPKGAGLPSGIYVWTDSSYDAEPLSMYLRYEIRDRYSISELENYIGTNTIYFTLDEPTEEEVAKAAEDYANGKYSYDGVMDAKEAEQDGASA